MHQKKKSIWLKWQSGFKRHISSSSGYISDSLKKRLHDMSVRIPTLGGLLPLLTPKSSSQLYFPSSPCFGVGLIPKMQRNSINFISTINMSSVAHLQGHFVELQCVELCFERPPTTNSTGELHLEPQSTCRVCISIS